MTPEPACPRGSELASPVAASEAVPMHARR
jgi:hypothetical protein